MRLRWIGWVCLGCLLALSGLAQAQVLAPCDGALSCQYLPIANGPGDPTATPVPSPVAVRVLSSRIISYGPLSYVVGEVQNQTDAPLAGVIVQMRYLDAGGALVGTDRVSARLPYLLPGQRSPFKTVGRPSLPSQRYELAASAPPLSSSPFYQLAVIEHMVIGQLITGKVRNQHTATLSPPIVVVTLYHADGTVLDMGSTLGRTPLAPGEIMDFAIHMTTPLSGTTMLVQAQAAR